MKARDVFGLSGAIALIAIAVLALPSVAGAAAPTLSIDHPVTPSITTAPVSGHVDAHGIGTIWTFEVTTDGVNWSPTNVSGFAETDGSEPVSGLIEGLSAGTDYAVRLGAFNFEEIVTYYSALTPTFTTEPAPNVPALALDPVGGVTFTTAQLSGSINPEGGNVDANVGLLPISWELQYAPASEPENWQPASATSESPLTGANAEGTSAVPVAAEAGGLKPGTEYAYRLLARYAGLSVSTPEAGYGHFTTNAAAKPAVSGLAATETLFSGFVNPGAPGPAPQDPVYDTHWEFTCSPGCSFDGASSGTLEASNTATEVTATPTGLTPNQSYDVTLHATNGAGEESETLTAAFATGALEPDIQRETLYEPTPTSIELRAQVNAHNAGLTDCHFEYGPGGSLGQTAPCDSLPSDEGFQVVSAEVTNLLPATEYSFRLVAANSAGVTEGDVRTFVTLEEPGPESCPNEEIRRTQHAERLPDCRAYEMVSPLEKGNGDIVGDGNNIIASKEGDGVAYMTRTPFGDTVGSQAAGNTQYLARRSGSGWTSHSITPAPNPVASQAVNTPTWFSGFSDDLSSASVAAYELPYVPNDVPDLLNLYHERTGPRTLEPISVSSGGLPNPAPFRFELRQIENWGMSDDGEHVAYESTGKFLPEAAGTPDAPASNVYQWDEGTLSLAGILPDGSVPSSGSEVSNNAQGTTVYRRNMSADGSRLLFRASAAGGPNQLYQRIDGTHTAWITESELAGGEEASGVRLDGATPDGRNIFFTTETKLVSADTDDLASLYRWTAGPDPEHENNLKLIASSGLETELMGISDDGEVAYFKTKGEDLTMWHQGESRVIINGVTVLSEGFGDLTAYSLIIYGTGYARVSPDGRYLGFLGITSGGAEDGYLYDRRSDSLKCVSCAASASVTFEAKATSAAVEFSYDWIRPRYLSNDGRLYFSTSAALSHDDVNGVLDAYQYDSRTGETALLSPGLTGNKSSFVEASASGDDVFIVTKDKLALADTDEFADLYDVRSGGGFAESASPASEPCSGEDCQGPAAQSPASFGAASAKVSRGNVVRVCRKPRPGRKPHPKAKRCRGAKKKHHHRRADANRRAHR